MLDQHGCLLGLVSKRTEQFVQHNETKDECSQSREYQYVVQVFVSFVKLRPKATVGHIVFFSKAQIIVALVSAFSLRFEYYVSVQLVF